MELLGPNSVKIKTAGRFKNLTNVINVEYLRPYRLRSENVGPPPHHLSIKPIDVEPEGEWYQIADILAHRGRAGPRQQCLVRWEGFDATHDSWVPRSDVTPIALIAYEKFLKEHAKEPGNQRALVSFIGEGGQFSPSAAAALEEERRQRRVAVLARKASTAADKAHRAVAASSHDVAPSAAAQAQDAHRQEQASTGRQLRRSTRARTRS